MRSLWDRLALGDDQNRAVAGEFLAWLDDRLVQDDAIGELGRVLPSATEEQLLSVVAAVGRVVRQP